LIKEDDSRRPKQSETLKQFAMSGFVLRDICLNQHELVELAGDIQIAKSKALHLDTRHAPVGIKIQHDGTIRLRQNLVQFLAGINLHKPAFYGFSHIWR